MTNSSPKPHNDYENLWSPLKGETRLFRTHRIVEVEDGKMEVKQTKVNIFFSILLCCIPLIFVFGGISNLETDPIQTGIPMLALGIIGLLGMIILTLSKTRSKLIFDRNRGYVSKKYLLKGEEEVYSLADVVGLQVIEQLNATSNISPGRGTSESTNRGFLSYQLNVVFKNGNRILVMNHGTKKAFDVDASKLATFLNVPIVLGERSEEIKAFIQRAKEYYANFGIEYP